MGPGYLRAELSVRIYDVGVFATSFGHLGDLAVPRIMRIIVNGMHWAGNVGIPQASKGVKTFRHVPKRVRKGNTRATVRKQWRRGTQ